MSNLVDHIISYLRFLLQVHGRHVATGRMVSGAYKTEYGNDSEMDEVSKRIEVLIY